MTERLPAKLCSHRRIGVRFGKGTDTEINGTDWKVHKLTHKNMAN